MGQAQSFLTNGGLNINIMSNLNQEEIEFIEKEIEACQEQIESISKTLEVSFEARKFYERRKAFLYRILSFINP